MKKIFSLIVGLLCAVGTTYADNVTLGRTVEFKAGINTYTLAQSNNAAVELSDGMGKTATGKEVNHGADKVNMACTCYRDKDAANANLKAYDNNSYAGFKVTLTEGYKIDISQLNVKTATSADFSYRVAIIDKDSKAVYTSSDYTMSSYSKAEATNQDLTVNFEEAKTLTGDFEVRLYYWNTGDKGSKYIVPLELTVTGDLAQVNNNQLAKPTVTYTEDGLVTITSNDTRATKLYYTTDGTEPSATNGNAYTEPFSAPGKTVKVIAVGDGYDNSDVVSVSVPKKVTATVANITKVTIDNENISDANLATLKENHTLTLSQKYAVAPSVAFVYVTETSYNDGSKETSEETKVDATVAEVSDNFVATATVDGVEYTINMPVDNSATISADVESFSLSAKCADFGKGTVKFKAVNTNGVLNVTMPKIEGLSYGMTKMVNGKEAAVNNGDAVAEDEEITMIVHFRSDVVVAKTDASLTIAVGDASLDIPFTYEDTKALITDFEKVEGSMEWDFSKAASADITSDRPSELVSFVNKDDFNESFPYQYLEAAAPYFYRNTNGGCYQGSDLHFCTTVSGTITVEFSNTGNNPARTAKVNDYIDDTKTSDNSKTKNTVECHVDAGDVHIYGYETAAQKVNYLRIYKVTFTADKTATIAINALNMTTYSNESAWEVPEGLTAYTAKYDADKNVIALNKVTETVIPAGVGVILAGENKTYTANLTTTTATELADNDLKATADAAVTADGTQYALVREKNDSGEVTGKACFGKMGNGQTIAKNKAYLVISDSNASKTLSIDFGGDTTGINAVEDTKAEADGAYYTLSGQKTVKPVKGLYIHNGKKYIAK